MNVTCPKCGEKLDAGPEIAGAVGCPSCGETIDMAALRSATCPICCTPFAEADEIKICPDCRTPHHVECWDDNRGCSTYGCGSARHEETHESSDGSQQIPCPACGAMHPATDMVCVKCGKLFGDALPSASAGSRILGALGKMSGAAREHLWPRLVRNFRLLGTDIAAAFRLWWGEFSRFVELGGRTKRREFVAFAGINYLVVLFFLLCEAPIIVVLWNLALFLPELAVCVRRLRDTDMSPWMIFAVPLLPFLLIVPTVETGTGPEPAVSGTLSDPGEPNGDNPS